MSNDNKIFAEVKRAASLVGYAEAALGGTVVKSGASTFINPAPCCSHNDCFSIFSPNKDGAQDAYKCHSCGAKGDVFTLTTEIQGLKMGEALRELAQFAGVPLPERDRPGADPSEPPREKSRAEYIADNCLADVKPAVDWLVEVRKIDHEVASRAAMARSIGWNTWCSTKLAPGERGHGGPAFASIVRSLNPGHVMAVDLRYDDPALNGGIKTMTQGEKQGYGWTSDIKRLHRAETVYFTESAINALSIESAKMPGKTAAFAIRGVGNAGNIDLTWMRGKQAIIVADNDPVGEDGYCAGMKAAWLLHERLTALDVSCLFVDMADWGEPDDINDVNDLLKDQGAEALRRALWKLEPWLIPGMQGDGGRDDLFAHKQLGRRRVFLPFHHDSVYWRFRVRPDFTSYISEIKTNEEGQPPAIEYKELAGFRVAAISRVTIQSATATMTGDEETMPNVRFSVSVQTTRHGPRLIRKTVDDEKLHNIDLWKRFGPVWDQSRFLRQVNILENAANIGARKAANFVGLCWKEGALVVNEGPDCYFQEPEKQCPYNNLTFPTGTPDQARQVIEAFQSTFGGNAASLLLVWALGGHLKAILGFWPHMVLQADKGSGKSTLIKRLERAIAFTMLSGQSTQSDFRLLTSVSHTSHPVGWEEISARKQQTIDAAVALLQESYQYTVTRRGSDMVEYLLCAPVLLAGEDVPIVSLTGKIVRSSLRTKGALIPDTLPRFPVRAWLQWLAEASPARIRQMYEETNAWVQRTSRASGEDNGAVRMGGNYAAILLAWRLLAEFAGLPAEHGNFRVDLMREMNDHIAQTSADRHPWVWIMERFAGELAAGRYQGPVKIDEITNEAGEREEVICLRTSDVMHHMATTAALRDFYNGLPVKSDRVFKKQMDHAGVIRGEVERTVGNKRYSRLAAVSLKALESFGVYVHRPDDRPY